jgi:hypothetical protein
VVALAFELGEDSLMANDDFVCVLRAQCRRPGLGALLRSFPRVKPDALWKAGVPNAVGSIPKANGFNVFLGEAGEWKPALAIIRRRMRSLAPMIQAGRKIGAKFELDIGVMLGASKYWTRSTRFAPKDLALLLDLGIELCVTAYPVSNESKRRAPKRRVRPRPRKRSGPANTRQRASAEPSRMAPQA